MKRITIKSSVLALALAAISGMGSQASAGVFTQLVSVANSALPAYGREQLLSYRPDLDKEQISNAIREALVVASDRVVETVVAEAGYQGDGEVKLSSDLRKAQKIATKGGHEEAFDLLEEQLNQAVIAAAPATRDLLKSAVAQIKITEPRVLLVAHDAAATDYLRMRVMERVQRQLQPVVEELLLESGAKHSCDNIASKIKFGNLLETLMTEHVVEYSLSGFFKQLEVEEKSIRRDPDSRSTDLLRDVFG